MLYLPFVLWPAPCAPALLAPGERAIELLVLHDGGLEALRAWASRLALRGVGDGRCIPLAIERIEPAPPAPCARASDALALEDVAGHARARVILVAAGELAPDPPARVRCFDLMCEAACCAAAASLRALQATVWCASPSPPTCTWPRCGTRSRTPSRATRRTFVQRLHDPAAHLAHMVDVLNARAARAGSTRWCSAAIWSTTSTACRAGACRAAPASRTCRSWWTTSRRSACRASRSRETTTSARRRGGRAQIAGIRAACADAAARRRGVALFLHAPLLHPPERGAVEEHVDRLDPGHDDGLAARVGFERRLFASGLRRGVFFRNPAPLVRALRADGAPVALFAGHVHRAHAMALARADGALCSTSLGEAASCGDRVALVTGPSLGQTDVCARKRRPAS